jgi:hypothetical protein
MCRTPTLIAGKPAIRANGDRAIPSSASCVHDDAISVDKAREDHDAAREQSPLDYADYIREVVGPGS